MESGPAVYRSTGNRIFDFLLGEIPFVKLVPEGKKKGTTYKKLASSGQKIKPVCGIYVVNLKNEKISPKFRNILREKTSDRI